MTKRIVAKVGEYQKDGQTKGNYVELGVILSNDNGEYILMNPSVSLSGVLQMQNRMNHAAGRKTGDKVMCGIFDNSQHGNSGGSANPQYDNTPDDTDIPF